MRFEAVRGGRAIPCDCPIAGGIFIHYFLELPNLCAQKRRKQIILI